MGNDGKEIVCGLFLSRNLIIKDLLLIKNKRIAKQTGGHVLEGRLVHTLT